MDAKIFRVNYKSDFILTLESDAGWMTPFCIKFWTGAPSQAYYVGWDGTTYNHCAYDPSEPTKLQVQFDDHHLPIGELKFQIAYHFTVADFPNDTEDEVINPANITTEIDGETYQVMLDLTGETAPEIQFSLPAYANEAQRIANEQQRIANEQARISQEQSRVQAEQQRVQQENARVVEFGNIQNQANDDHLRANEDHSVAVDDHHQAVSDHGIAVDDHTQAGNDHTRAESDHSVAVDDHTQAGNDHTRAESDHSVAVDDHTQAGNDHTRAESDHSTAASDHTQAGNDHTRAESDHTRAESDHAAVEVFVDSLGVFDLSKHNAVNGVLATYANLSAALTALNALESKYKYGGMSFKFVQSSDNKYVQYRLIAQNFTTDATQWQEDEKIVSTGSDGNESLSFVDEEGNCPLQIKDGNIKTKNFDSTTVATTTYVDEKVEETISELDYVPVDNVDDNEERLSFVDETGECVVQFKNGHIKTKNFDSENIEIDKPEIIIPDRIVAVVNDTLQLYFKSILNTPNNTNYGIIAQCNIGKSYPRYFEVKPKASDVGNHVLDIVVYGTNENVVTTKSVTLEVVQQASSPSTTKNILVIGASTLADGVVVSEANRRFTAITGDGTPYFPTGLGLTNINFVGRKEVNGIHEESTGGYSWRSYATDYLKAVRFYVTGVEGISLGSTFYIDGVSRTETYFFTVIEVNITEGTGNILCEVYGGYVYESLPDSGTLVKITGSADNTIQYSSYLFEPGNPFWNNGGIDFQNYSTQYCNGADIDIIYTHLGLNGFRTKEDVDNAIVNYTKPFIRQYHIDYPNGKFVLGTLQLGSPYGGYGSIGSSQNWYAISDTYLYALKKYQEIAQDNEFSSYVIISGCTPEFDCENAYPTTNKAVSNRSTATEVIQTNQIHPTSDGKKLISDSIYRTITKILNI